MLRIVAIGLLCLLLALPTAAEETSGQEGLLSQVWEGFLEILGLEDYESPVEPSDAAGDDSSTSPPSDQLGPGLIPNG